MYYSTIAKVIAPKPSDKSGTKKSRKSVIADGDLVNELQANGYFARKPARVSRVVVSRSPVSLPISYPDVLKPKRKPWRDRGEEVQGLFFHDALVGKRGVKGFTLMLSRPVETLARSKGKHCLAWLHRRVVRQLKPLSGLYSPGPVQFWFAIEESDAGRLHIHGEISLGDIGTEGRSVRSLRRAFAPFRAALKAAGGKWDEDRDGEGRQLRFARGTPDFRWAGYCLKGVQKARPERRRYMRRFGSDRRWVAEFEGKAVTPGRAVRESAIRLYGAIKT